MKADQAAPTPNRQERVLLTTELHCCFWLMAGDASTHRRRWELDNAGRDGAPPLAETEISNGQSCDLVDAASPRVAEDTAEEGALQEVPTNPSGPRRRAAAASQARRSEDVVDFLGRQISERSTATPTSAPIFGVRRAATP